MRIGVDAAWAGLPGHGTGTYTRGLVQALVQYSRHEYVLYFPPGHEAANPLWSLPASNITRRVVGGHRHHDRILVGLTRAAYRDRLDLFHSPGYMLPLWPGPKVVTFHDANMFLHRSQQWRSGRRLSWLALTAHTLLASRTARHVLADSEQAADDLQRVLRLPQSRLSVVYPGIDDVYFAPPDDGAVRSIRERHQLDQYLLFVSQLTPQKNVEGLVRAFAHLDRPGLHLALAGREDGPYFSDVVRPLIRALGMDGRVAILGVVPPAALPGLYAHARAFVNPSFAEGFGLTPLEAMACGTPVVASNTSCVPEVLGDAAVLVDPSDIPALSRAMELAAFDSRVRNTLVPRGRERAGRFRWCNTAAATLRVYEAVA